MGPDKGLVEWEDGAITSSVLLLKRRNILMGQCHHKGTYKNLQGIIGSRMLSRIISVLHEYLVEYYLAKSLPQVGARKTKRKTSHWLWCLIRNALQIYSSKCVLMKRMPCLMTLPVIEPLY